jgi:GntR family transcriptional regulator
MLQKKLERSQPISDQLQEILKERIRNDDYPAGAKFPSESDLAEDFGVSRITVRRACTKLVTEGLIVRRWGVGTFVSRIAQIMNPINQVIDFKELIKSAGFKPAVKIESTQAISAGQALAESLSVNEGDRLIEIKSTFTADGNPAILATTHIPEWLLGDDFGHILADPEITEPFLDFLKTRCNQKVMNMVTVFWPDTLKGCEISLAGQDPTTAVLVMNHIAYNADEMPIFASSQIHIGNIMKYTVIRQGEDHG